MNIPGFNAEAALRTRGGCQQTARNRGLPGSGKVVPALQPVGEYYWDRYSDDGCYYSICHWSWYDGPPYFTTYCTTPEFICAH
jgi:hypothetical protein